MAETGACTLCILYKQPNRSTSCKSIMHNLSYIHTYDKLFSHVLVLDIHCSYSIGDASTTVHLTRRDFSSVYMGRGIMLPSWYCSSSNISSVLTPSSGGWDREGRRGRRSRRRRWNRGVRGGGVSAEFSATVRWWIAFWVLLCSSCHIGAFGHIPLTHEYHEDEGIQ